MKYEILRENEPLEIRTATEHQVVPTTPGKQDTKVVEVTKMSTNVFTDGNIVKEDEERVYNISGYYYDEYRRPYHVDTIKMKDIYIKNHSYVVVYTIREEHRKNGNVFGLFDVIANITVYLKQPKDKKALKEAKTAIKEIRRVCNSVDYSSGFTAMFGPQEGMKKFEQQEVSEGVYTLKRIKK